MRLSLIVPTFVIIAAAIAASVEVQDFASACYNTTLPAIPPSIANRTIPWGKPSFEVNGTTCCSSLDEVRAGIDALDTQLLDILSQRAAYVREATRFKATRDSVDVPARDEQVINDAVADAPKFNLPQTIARAVFTAIIESGVGFEQCVVSALAV
ncbi:hypothetical protein HGRIS_007147 [Hohenbuehelia grisea]|uniref:Chorismate mutase domain-containing protein n=1 Tax=Hohenbuehelia grisea TaxID=104357 RepID=A0ABR3JBA4_9AGAR